MELILWRHAEAEDSMPDAERKLTKKGLRQAMRVAEWLGSRMPKESRILVSPARRAQQTASALGLDFATNQHIAPGSGPDEVLMAVDWSNDESGTVLVVGHQPTLGAVAGLLIVRQPISFSIKKGALWWLSCKKTNGIEKIVLRAVISPDLV